MVEVNNTLEKQHVARTVLDSEYAFPIVGVVFCINFYSTVHLNEKFTGLEHFFPINLQKTLI